MFLIIYLLRTAASRNYIGIALSILGNRVKILNEVYYK